MSTSSPLPSRVPVSSSPGQGWKERTRPRATDGHREDESISAPVAVRQELNRLLHCEAASALKSAKIYNSRLSINIISQRSHSKGCRRHADSQLPQKDVAYEERHLSSSCPGTAPPPNQSSRLQPDICDLLILVTSQHSQFRTPQNPPIK